MFVCILIFVPFLPPSRAEEVSLEEPADLLSLRVQVDVVETRAGGQTGDCGHLNKAAASENSAGNITRSVIFNEPRERFY